MKAPRFALLVAGSVLVHLALFAGADYGARKLAGAAREAVPVKIKVSESPPDPEPPPPAPPPAPPPKAKPPPQAAASKREPLPEQTVAPVQGLSKESFTEGAGSGFVAPAGNNLMSPDEGKRLRPEEVAGLTKDLSADAVLIRETLAVPQYTEAAVDAGLEGRFLLDVFVDAKGEVRQVEVRRRIGYGMDERVRQAVMRARFTPRKNAVGAPIEGWVELPITFVLP